MGSVGEVLPSRDSTRIVKHTFDSAKIGIISESCKYFSFYFHFLPPRTFNSHFFVFLQRPYPRPRADGVRTATIAREAAIMDKARSFGRYIGKESLEQPYAQWIKEHADDYC